MEQLKTYLEWKEEYEVLGNLKVVYDKGSVYLGFEGNTVDTLMTYQEALQYLIQCTIIFNHE